ncbi:DNA repair protein RecN [Puniceicoccales bacterium CK1056]|uniref:DNA repair protein RecN n=1 Tax=Oceanipulchritudo coccoides TaxID=2706888 RepID=A0A6B2LZK6_9BACT|nr:DNA repair protein RecN [Oceanipulchritudo coccoides]NDV60935.1 DNA repair protein RecN [Oceanipulchritudo coccoides]
MLHTLRIENLALMDAVSLEFEKGYTAVTGETGAGKSVLLGALSLLSGARADKTLIRQGTDTCTLEAAFHFTESAQLDSLLEQMGLPLCEEGQFLLRRIVSKSKPSRIQINGAMATQTQLQEIGKQWIDFHGPGEPQKLFHETEQLALLDLFAGLKKDLAAYRKEYRDWRGQLERIEDLRKETRLSPEEAAFLNSQIKEIDELKLTDERISQLEQDFRRISSSQELKEACSQIDGRFLGSKGICSQLQSVLPLARKLAELDPSAAQLADRVESLVIEANDLSGEWAELANDADFDPRQIKQIEADMDKWLNIRRRYGASVETIIAKREQMAERLSLQGNIEETIEKLQQEADEKRSELAKLAAAMRSIRLKAAHKLGKQSQSLLQELGFKNPKLSIEIVAREKLGPSGDCECRMTFSPNPGSDQLPLNKIASSGEMARVMLALKSVLAAVDATPLLVFDEVDSNIGGEVATSVAGLLADLGQDHQVFCITHLPQVAAVAKNHYLVEKDQSDKATTVSIRCLNDDKTRRLDEFARMLGDRTSKSARKHAEALLGQSS